MAEEVVKTDKKIWQSKTLWMSLIVAILAFFPSVQIFATKNPEAVGTILGLVFSALRLLTKGKIVIE